MSGSDNNDNNDVDVYHFVWGATRGDGARGEDVTEAVCSAWMGMDDDAAAAACVGGAYDRPPSVPRTLAIPRSIVPPPNALEIRWEVVLPRRAFDEFVWGDDSDADTDTKMRRDPDILAGCAGAGMTFPPCGDFRRNERDYKDEDLGRMATSLSTIVASSARNLAALTWVRSTDRACRHRRLDLRMWEVSEVSSETT